MEYTNCGPLETDDIQASSCEDYLRNISDMSNSQRRYTLNYTYIYTVHRIYSVQRVKVMEQNLAKPLCIVGV